MSLFANAMYLAWADTKARYKRSVLGPFWMTLSNIIGIGGLGLIWSVILQEDRQTFIPSLTIGMVVWQLISGTLTESTSIFTRHMTVIRNVSMPLWFFAVRGMARQIINFSHNIVIIIGAIVIFRLPADPLWLWVIPGLLLVFANLGWIMLTLGILGARFRDIEYTITAFMPLLFFVSPILFRLGHLAGRDYVILWNPVTYFVRAIRSPILLEDPGDWTYAVLLGMLAVGVPFTTWLYRKYAKNIPYWV